jgi:hypothetical protein
MNPGLRILPWAFLFLGPFLVAQSPPCPAVITALLPKGAARATGSYQGQGIVAMGGGTARLAFAHPCLSETHPARWSVEIQHYEGEGVQLLRMQVDGFEQQVLQNERSEAQRRLAKSRGGTSPIREEALVGGRVILSAQSRPCPADQPNVKNPAAVPIPMVRLVGVAHTSSTRITLTIEGDLSPEAALAAARETFENLAKLTF